MIKAWRRWRTQKRWQGRERVLGALALATRRGDPEMPGWPLMQATGPRPGRLYVALKALEHRGEVASRWATGTATPRRRYYGLADEIDVAFAELEGCPSIWS